MTARLRTLLRRVLVRGDGVAQRLKRIEKQQEAQRELLREVARSIRRLEKSLDPRSTAGRTIRIEQNVQAVLRLLALDRDALPYPQRLTAARFRLRSQNGEDGITLRLVREAGAPLGLFVELGSGDNGGNTGFLAEELGWRGLMVDGAAEKLSILGGTVSPERVAVVQAWITADSVNDLVSSNGFTGDIDVLSIDVDGNDYWLWKNLVAVSPRLVIIEYNSMFGAERAVVVPYDPEFRRRTIEGAKGTYYGASLRAQTLLAESRGYRLVAVEARGANAYFMRNDIAEHIPAVDPRAEFRLLDKYAALRSTGFDMWHFLEKQRLPLIDLDRDERPAER